MKDKFMLILGIVTVLVGTVGFLLNDTPPYESFLDGLSFLTLNLNAEPTNVFIEIARWLGFVFAMGLVYSIVKMALNRSAEDIAMRRALHKPNPVAIHGDGVFALALAENMGPSAICSDLPSSYKAPTQVLLFSSDDDAMDFFSKNRSRLLAAEEVYVSLDNVCPDAANAEGVFVFSMADICAQLYWDEHPVITAEKIALIGTGAYAEALLTQGLLVNIFDVPGGVNYLAIGDYSEYRNLHRSLDAAMRLNNDSLVFVDEPWYECLDQLAQCDRIILCGTSDENIKVASALRRSVIPPSIHLRADSVACLDFIGERDRVDVFGTTDQLCTSSIIVQQAHHKAGKICDITYRMGTPECNGCMRFAGFPEEDITYDLPEDEKLRIKNERLDAIQHEKCLTCERFKKDWSNMTDFQRRSNYAVAAHDAHKAVLLRERENAGRGELRDFAALPLEERDRLQEIEHMRWCRFHYLNNWIYGTTEDGKRNPEARIHPLLVPYNELSRFEKDKDGDSYMTLSSRMRGYR